MVVAKSEARRDPTAYFRAAKTWPSLITVLGLGYFAVGVGKCCGVWAAPVLVGAGGREGAQFCARARRLPRLLVYTEVRGLGGISS